MAQQNAALADAEPHIHDVLTAVANSRLRVQITQVQLQHAEGIRPGASGDALAGGPGGMPGMMGPGGLGRGGDPDAPAGPGAAGALGPGAMQPGMGGPGMAGPGMMGPGMAGPGMMGPGMPGMGGAPGFGYEEADPNLVEMAVYGIASLYERFPPKPPADAAATPAADAAAPATGDSAEKK